ncbi:MAG: EamA family transporter [Gammaproteobacteria bacterium]|nr:EamA family transporter [Gammaproteobacteria bacterium]
MIAYSFAAFLCSIMYAFSAIFCKIGLQNAVAGSFSLSRLFEFLIHRKIWVLGVAMSGLANIAMIQIQSRLDISIVYSFLNLSYVLILILGHYWLKEMLSQLQWIGVAIVIIGTVLLLIVPDPVSGHATNYKVLIVMTVFAVTAVISLVLAARVYSSETNYEIFFALCTGICFGSLEIYLKTTTNLVSDELGGFSIFSLSSVSSFIQSWPFIAMFFFGAVGWLCLQMTYSHGNISVTVPIVAVTQRVVSVLAGYFVFDEDFSLLRITSILSIICGVLVLVLASIRARPVRVA